MNAPHPFLDEARRRIADCFHGRDKQGRLIQRRDALNLAGLGLTAEEIEKRFNGDAYAETKRGLGEIGFEDLVHLRYLDLTSNKLTRLPRGMASFANLRWLGLNFNQLTSLDLAVGDWLEIERLYLRGNAIRTLPEAAELWSSLQELDLAENKELQSLPHEWLNALKQRPSSAGEASAIVVELEGSGLATAFEKEKKKKLTRENFHELEVQQWLNTRVHIPTTPKEVREWIRQWGEKPLTDALASLGLRDSHWMSMLEDPAAGYRRMLEAAGLPELEMELRRQKGQLPPKSVGHPLWRAWYATGLRRIREADEARSPSAAAANTTDADPASASRTEDLEVASSALPMPPAGAKKRSRSGRPKAP